MFAICKSCIFTILSTFILCSGFAFANSTPIKEVSSLLPATHTPPVKGASSLLSYPYHDPVDAYTGSTLGPAINPTSTTTTTQSPVTIAKGGGSSATSTAALVLGFIALSLARNPTSSTTRNLQSTSTTPLPRCRSRRTARKKRTINASQKSTYDAARKVAAATYSHDSSASSRTPFSDYPKNNQSPISYWPSRDPIEEEGGINVYSFCYNSPFVWHDVWGREPRMTDREKEIEFDRRRKENNERYENAKNNKNAPEAGALIDLGNGAGVINKIGTGDDLTVKTWAMFTRGTTEGCEEGCAKLFWSRKEMLLIKRSPSAQVHEQAHQDDAVKAWNMGVAIVEGYLDTCFKLEKAKCYNELTMLVSAYSRETYRYDADYMHVHGRVLDGEDDIGRYPDYALGGAIETLRRQGILLDNTTKAYLKKKSECDAL